MTSYNNSELSAPDMTVNTHTGNGWVFQGKTVFESVYEDIFEADIDPIPESVGDDSGYYSNEAESSEAINYDFILYDDHSSPDILEFETAGSVSEQRRFYPNAAASNESNHGSLFDNTLNKSTTHAEKSASFGKKSKETRMSKTVYHPVHEYEHKPLHKYSSVKSEAGDQRPLEIWETTYHRHEWNAYQLEQPVKGRSSKRRKTSSKK